MPTTLPQHDTQAAERAEKLDEARSDLPYAWDRPAGVATAASVPRRFSYPAGVILQASEAEVILAANRVEVDLFDRPVSGPSSPDWCARIFHTIDAPPSLRIWSDDRGFAWQRLAGAHPLMLTRVAGVPVNFPVSEQVYQRVMAGDSLAAAGAEGRLFVCDYALLDGLAAGTSRFVCAPLALFASGPGGGPLLPVAIQCGQRPGAATPIFTPLDGEAWRLARLAVQVADANVHESYHHLGRAHFLTEAFAMATERQLSSRHPLYALLSAHFDGTLAINGAARDKLVVPGGDLETLLNPSLEGSLDLVRRSLSSFRLDEATLPRDLARRGVDDTMTLPDYAYRDDGRLIWHAIEEFVRDYVGLTYADEGEIANDTELRAWLGEMRAHDGGRLTGLPEQIDGARGLTELLTFIVYTASAFHAALNYTQYDFMGHTPSQPMAAYAAPPSGAVSDPDDAWARTLTDRPGALAQLDFAYRQSRVRDNRLGHYPPMTFRDDRVREPLRRFRDRLDAIENQIAERNRERLLPYPYLLPSLLTASIHI